MKKEYLHPLSQELDKLSDTELVDTIAKTKDAQYDNTIEAAKAILDQRTKRTLQYLTEVIQKSNESTEKYNISLKRLTIWLLVFTIIMAVATIPASIEVLRSIF